MKRCTLEDLLQLCRSAGMNFRATDTYLQVLVRVPVRVIDDDGVGGCEVDAQAARARGQQEAEGVRALVEGFDGGLAVLPLDAAVYAR